MCLLVIERASQEPLCDEFLTGVYSRNSDGIGVMWAENDTLYYNKALPASAEEFIEFYRTKIAGKDCAWHARMRTHGDIDMENCHPYPVFGFEGTDGAGVNYPMALMHNGVIHHAAAGKDKSKSDTWHYIRDTLQPLLRDNPEVITNKALISMIGRDIGTGSKFAILDFAGNMTLVNEQAFTEYKGRLLSNTYAWDYYGLHPNAPKLPTRSYPARGTWSGGTFTPAKKSNPAERKALPGNTKPGGKKSRTTTKGGGTDNFVPIVLASEVQEYRANIIDHNADVGDQVHFWMVNKLFRDVHFRDAWDLLDLWQMGEIADGDFLSVLGANKKCENVLENWRNKMKDARQDGLFDSFIL